MKSYIEQLMYLSKIRSYEIPKETVNKAVKLLQKFDKQIDKLINKPMKIKWPTGFGKQGKVFNIKPNELWSESEIAEVYWPQLALVVKPKIGHPVIDLVECIRMSAKQVYTKEQLEQYNNHIHVEFPRSFKHYLVVRLDTNTAVKWSSNFKRREDPYSGR